MLNPNQLLSLIIENYYRTCEKLFKLNFHLLAIFVAHVN